MQDADQPVGDLAQGGVVLGAAGALGVVKGAGAGRCGQGGGSKGDSYDNALAETIIGLYKAELITHRGPWHSLAQVETATAWWVGWFNNRRLYRPLGDIPPAEYEQNWLDGRTP